jgi:hypothetical protein
MLYVLIQTGFCLCNHSQCQRGEMLAPALPTCIADISQHPYNSKATEHSNTHTMHAIYLLRIVWLHDINGQCMIICALHRAFSYDSAGCMHAIKLYA